MTQPFTGVKVFSASKSRDREFLGETLTAWLRSSGVEPVEVRVAQSSDSAFHCLSLILFYRGTPA